MSRIFLNLAVALLLLVKVHNGSAVDTARLMDDNERNRAGSKLNNLLHAAAARRAGDLEEVKMPDDDDQELISGGGAEPMEGSRLPATAQQEEDAGRERDADGRDPEGSTTGPEKHAPEMMPAGVEVELAASHRRPTSLT